MNIQRFLSKYRYLIVGAVLISVGLLVWTVSGSLVEWSNSVVSGVQSSNVKKEDTSNGGEVDKTRLESREYIDTPTGKKYLLEGSDGDKAFQSVYDYFSRHLPDIDIESTSYKVYEDGDDNYIVSWGDWVVFVQKSKASGGFFPVQLNKSVPFTEKEKELMRGLSKGHFEESGGIFEYVFD